jgi:outer membrane protein TolC
MCSSRLNPCAAFVLLTAAILSAQTRGPLSLDDCIRLADFAQSTAGVARRQMEIARQNLTIAKAGFLPQTAVTTSFTYNSPNHGEFSFVALNGVREYTTIGNLSLDIDTSGRLRAQLARARADQDAAVVNVVLAQRDLKRAVTVSYYQVLLARNLAEVTRTSLDEALAFEKRTRLLVEAGEAARADVVKASAEVEFLRQTLNAALLEARLANHELASFWTTDVMQELTLVDVLNQPPPAPPAAAPSKAAYMGRPEFRLFDAQRRGFLADARHARADLYPQLSLITQYGLDANRYSFAERGFATFVNLRIPVFDWFKTRATARQFDLQAQQIETNRQISRRTFSREYADALARVEATYSLISIAANQVSFSEDNYRLAKVRYEGGEGSALDVVTAQSQLAQARSNSYAARAKYLNARAELEVAAGR